MQESPRRPKYHDSIRWMKIIRDLTDQAKLSVKLEEKITALVVEIARESPSEFLQDFYYGEFRNALKYFLEKPNSRWLVAYLDLLEKELKQPENTYHEHSCFDTPFYPRLFRPYVTPTAYVPQTRPSAHTPIQPVTTQSVPKAARSSPHPDPSSVQNKEHGTSHADSPDYCTKNMMNKVQKNRPSSTLPDTGLQSVRLESATSTVGYTAKAEHAEASLSRENPFQRIVRSNKVQKPTENAQTPDNMIRPQPVSGLKDAATQIQSSCSGTTAIPASTGAGISRQIPVSKILQGAVSENGVIRQNHHNEGAKQVPRKGQSISGEPVQVDKQPGACFKKHEAPAKKEDSEKPRELTSGQGPKRRLLNREPVSNWNISEPVYVAIDFGAHKETRQVSSVGISALDSRRKQQGMASIQWMGTSETEYWKIKEAFDQRPPPPHYPLLHSGSERMFKREDIKRAFKWFMKRFKGRNVVLTFHDARNDHEWMEGLGMDPDSIRSVNIVGEFDTMIAASCKLKNPNLRVAVGWIGYPMEENEWHNSANDAFNTNRLVASMVYGLHASAGNPKFPWPEDGVFEPDNRVFFLRR